MLNYDSYNAKVTQVDETGNSYFRVEVKRHFRFTANTLSPCDRFASRRYRKLRYHDIDDDRIDKERYCNLASDTDDNYRIGNSIICAGDSGLITSSGLSTHLARATLSTCTRWRNCSKQFTKYRLR
jgi:hypothetical protein